MNVDIENSWSSTSSSLTTVHIVISTAAIVFGSTLTLLQLDSISRRLLSPKRLSIKRRNEYRYRIQRGIAEAQLRVHQYLAGGTKRYDPRFEENHLELITTDKEMDELINTDIFRTNKDGDDVTKKKNENTRDGENASSAAPIIVTIDLDDKDERNTREYFLYLAFPPAPSPSSKSQQGKNTTHGSKQWRLVQVPLVAFGLKLATTFEEQLTSTAFCFVSDASSGLGSTVLATVVEQSNAGVAVIKEPAWMTSFATIVEKRIIPTSKLEKVLFGLCRLDGWRVRNNVGASRTVLFTLPGQSCTPTLLPLLQASFPCERHVFAYNGCTDSVIRAMQLRRWPNKKRVHVPRVIEETNTSSTTATIPNEIMAMPQVLTASTPITPLRTVRNLEEQLANIPSKYADTVECWMGSVDTFLQMKENEKNNGYLPFVLRMGFVMGDAGRLGNGDVDNSDLALTNIMQFVTGSRSRPIRPEVLDAARMALAAVRVECKKLTEGVTIRENERLAIERCVFAHKGILIGDKTLIDTVQPSKEWSLKAAKKISGCSCCAPEEEDEEEEEGGTIGGNGGAALENNGSMNQRRGDIDLSVPGAFATGLKQRTGAGNSSRPKYVDGKTAFAFDPTAFSK